MGRVYTSLISLDVDINFITSLVENRLFVHRIQNIKWFTHDALYSETANYCSRLTVGQSLITALQSKMHQHTRLQHPITRSCRDMKSDKNLNVDSHADEDAGGTPIVLSQLRSGELKM